MLWKILEKRRLNSLRLTDALAGSKEETRSAKSYQSARNGDPNSSYFLYFVDRFSASIAAHHFFRSLR